MIILSYIRKQHLNLRASECNKEMSGFTTNHNHDNGLGCTITDGVALTFPPIKMRFRRLLKNADSQCLYGRNLHNAFKILHSSSSQQVYGSAQSFHYLISQRLSRSRVLSSVQVTIDGNMNLHI
jgi:hypothetical protein